MGFPRFKNRYSRQAVTFVELADGVDHRHWINRDTRSHVRLMLPQRAGDGTWERRHTRPKSQQADGRDRRDEVAWLHTHQPDAVAEVWRLCETGRAKIQALTIKYGGGQWRAVFQLRLLDGTNRLRNPGEPVTHHGGSIGVGMAEASMAELVRQLEYKTTDRGASLVKVGRYYPSSQTCSRCGARTKLPLWQRVYDCSTCGLTLDRDVNAARNIRAEGESLVCEQHEKDVASIRGETGNGEPRPGETEPASGAGGHGSSEAATDPAAPAFVGVA